MHTVSEIYDSRPLAIPLTSFPRSRMFFFSFSFIHLCICCFLFHVRPVRSNLSYLSHSTWLGPLIVETAGFTYGIIIIQCQGRNAGVQSLLFRVFLLLSAVQLFRQPNLCVCVCASNQCACVRVAQKEKTKNKTKQQHRLDFPFAKERGSS